MMVGRRTVRLIVMLGAVCGMAGAVRAAPVKNIVLVHGAWVDGSGWRPVYDILKRDGYDVTIVQQPLSGLEDASPRPGAS